MERQVLFFKKDSEDHWCAVLDCGHPQHTRHKPPFEIREWTLTEEGRASRIGMKLNCVRCDEFELPEALKLRSKSPLFNNSSIPPALLKEHQTKPGVWGRISIVSGELYLHFDTINTLLRPELHGIIPPGRSHRVEATSEVEFFIEFLEPDFAALK